MPTLRDRLKKGWNAFINNKDPTDTEFKYGTSVYYRQDRTRRPIGNERSIVTAILNRIAIDVAAVKIVHARVNDNGQYTETINSTLNAVLTLDANIDQTGRALIQDIAFSVLDEGCIAVVPVDTDVDPTDTSSYDIWTMRVGKVLEWRPTTVRIRLYNDLTGQKEDIILPKTSVAIIENPLYEIMNGPNSTLQRLIRKLNILDAIDEQSGSSKLDLIIQLPYAVKSSARQEQAEARRKAIEDQLYESKYGIAYIDSTEHVTQLNRSLENNLMAQIEYLTKLLYSQLGITEEVMNGTANEQTMLNYHNRTIEPILAAICDSFNRTFLTKTARTQGQSIVYMREPFKLVPVNSIAEIADKFTRNEIMSPNEIRGIMGLKPSNDAAANELRNRNINQSNADIESGSGGLVDQEAELEELTGYEEELEDLISQLDDKSLEQSDIDISDEYLEVSGDLAEDYYALIHYASPYYDPVKAHEYYEQHKKLKGRTTTSSLNEEGKIAAETVKTALDKERDAKLEAEAKRRDEELEKNTNDASNHASAYSAAVGRMVESLRERAKSATSAKDKAAISAHMQNLLNRVKARTAEIKAALKEQNASTRETSKTNISNIKSEYKTKYEDELEKINAESSFQKVAASKGSSGSSGSKSGKSSTKKRHAITAESRALNDAYLARK